MGMTRKDALVFSLCLLLVVWAVSPIFAQPPAINTIEHNVGIYYDIVAANDFWFRGVNLTGLFVNVTEALENFTGPLFVYEATVEGGLVLGTTGDWFNHTLPGEPVYIGLQMHPTNITYDSVLVLPVVYDKDATHWQLALYWVNGTQITDNTDLRVMYHMRWEPGGVDPNEPQLPEEEPE